MVRKMAYIGSFWLIGLFLASFLSFSVDLAVSAFVFADAVLLLVIYKTKYVKYAVCAISFSAAVLCYGIYDFFVYRNIIKYDGCSVEVKGVITGYADHSGDKASYTIKGVINDDVKAVVTCYADSISAGVGDKVKVIGKAETFSDSYTFPAESYYRSKGIFLKINNVKNLNYLENDGFSLIKIFDLYRERIIKVIDSNLGVRERSVMAAMLFGDKSDLESSDKTIMYRAGIGHIMAVSGVHMAVVCLFFGYIIDLLPLNRYVRFGMLLIPVFCFSLLAGMSASVIRSAIMIIIVNAGKLFRRRADTFNSLGIAIIMLTAASPFAVRDPSFLLSTAGVFGAGVMAPAAAGYIEKKRPIGAFMRSLIMTICINAVIFPAAVMFFDEFSLISPLTNIFLMPICEVILICGIIVTVTGGIGIIAAPVLGLSGALCGIVIKTAEFVGNIHCLYIPLGSGIAKLSALAAVILAAASFAIYRKAEITGIVTVCIFLMTVFFINIYRIIPDDNITVAVFRNENAYSAVIHDKQSAVIIDLKGGGKTSGDAVKYLNRKGIYRINALIINSGANIAVPVYKEKLILFDTAEIFIPQEYAAFADNGVNGILYGKDRGFDFPEYSVFIEDNDTVTVKTDDIGLVIYPFSAGSGNGYAAKVFCSGEPYRYSYEEIKPDREISIDCDMEFSINASDGVVCDILQ